MALPNNPLINGLYPDFSVINISIPGFRLLGVGCTEINYSFKNEPGEAEGTQQQVLGLTPGQYRAEGSITLHKRWAGELREVLARRGGFLSQLFNMDVQYDMNDGLGPIEDNLVGCKIKNGENGHKSGADPLVEKIDLYILYYLPDGLEPLDNMRL